MAKARSGFGIPLAGLVIRHFHIVLTHSFGIDLLLRQVASLMLFQKAVCILGRVYVLLYQASYRTDRMQKNQTSELIFGNTYVLAAPKAIVMMIGKSGEYASFLSLTISANSDL